MLMQQVRAFRRAAARATAWLLAALLVLGATGWGHTGWDDDACDPTPVHHDHNAHRFQHGRLPLNPATDHCLFCHTLRSLGHGLVAVQTPVENGTRVLAVRLSDVVLAGRLLDPNAPSRAPPAVLL
jgi:hypothetical protein